MGESGERIRVALPSRNPQFMAFWVADAGGLFGASGIDLELTVAAEPLGAPIALLSGSADVAVLSPPLYLRLIADRRPVLVLANLLRNDPLNVVVNSRVAGERGFHPWLDVAGRIALLRGLRIGVAPIPVDHLHTLCAWGGLDVGDVELVMLQGFEQNPGFATGQVDALYAHTPYLERALVDDGGVLLVHTSGGEVPPARVGQVHALLATSEFAQRRPAAAAALVAAIDEAGELVRRRDPRALEALLACGFPGVDRPHVERTLEIYGPAMPDSASVTCATLREADAFRPTGSGVALMDDADLAPFLLSDRS